MSGHAWTTGSAGSGPGVLPADPGAPSAGRRPRAPPQPWQRQVRCRPDGEVSDSCCSLHPGAESGRRLEIATLEPGAIQRRLRPSLASCSQRASSPGGARAGQAGRAAAAAPGPAAPGAEEGYRRSAWDAMLLDGHALGEVARPITSSPQARRCVRQQLERDYGDHGRSSGALRERGAGCSPGRADLIPSS